MTNPEIPLLLLAGLCFLAGFAAAILVAVAFDRGAREIAEKNAEDNLPLDG